MKKTATLIAITTVSALALSACSSTWNGVKEDTRENVQAVGDGVEKGWDKTKEAARDGANAVGRGMSNAGEKLQNATE